MISVRKPIKQSPNEFGSGKTATAGSTSIQILQKDIKTMKWLESQEQESIRKTGLAIIPIENVPKETKILDSVRVMCRERNQVQGKVECSWRAARTEDQLLGNICTSGDVDHSQTTAHLYYHTRLGFR